MARTHLVDIRRLDREIKTNKTLIRSAVAASLVGYTGDIGRFASADHYAAYNGPYPSKSPQEERNATDCR